MKDIKPSSIYSEFFTNLSHEFRTPLTLILGPTQDLMEEITDDEQKIKLQGIQANASRLLLLVNQLLDLSKSESGKLTLSTNPFSINGLVFSVCESFQNFADGKSITFKTIFIEKDITLEGDSEKIQTVLYNLIMNSLKFTPEGQEVCVKAEYKNDFLTISVSDNGIGIKKEKIPHIFDRFFQAESYFPMGDNFVRNEPGTGIGLALCKSLVELHGGTIAVESEPGIGSNFYFSIPLNTTSKTVAENELNPLLNHISSSSNLEKEITIVPSTDLPVLLFVEDNHDLAKYIFSILNDSYSIIYAKNGSEALALSEEQIPDIILSDNMMPEMSGIEFCRNIKKNAKTSHIPFILLTADASEVTRVEALQLGVDEIMLKPFNSRNLVQKLFNLMTIRAKVWKAAKENVLNLKDANELKSLDQQFLENVTSTINSNIENYDLNIEQLATEVGYSRAQLHRKLKAISGQSATEFIRNIRLNKAKVYLENRSGNISEIAYKVGFTSPSYFTKCFVKTFKFNPSEIMNIQKEK